MADAERTLRLPAVVIGAFALLIYAATGTAEDNDLRVDSPHLNVGYTMNVFTDVDTEDARSVTKVWSEQILKRWFQEGTSESAIFEDMESLEFAFRKKNIDLVAMVSDDYVHLKNRVPVQPVFVTENHNGIYHQIVLLVRRDRGIHTLGDLRHKQLMVPLEQARTIHMTWLETLLMKEGVGSAEEFFSTVKEVRKPSQGILPVFFKQADACLTTRQSFRVVCELNPQVGKELTILAISPDIAGGVIVFRPDYTEEYKNKLTEILLKVQTDPQGRQLFKLFRIYRLIPFRPEYLETVEALLEEHTRLRLKLARRN